MTSPSATVMIDLTLSVAVLVVLAFLWVRIRHTQQAAVSAASDLKRSEERFRRLAESSPLGIFELDAQGKRVYANPRLLDITGDTELPSPIGNTPDAPQSGRWRIKRSDGELRWVRFDAAPLVSED